MAGKEFTAAQIEEFDAAREAGLPAPEWATNFVWSPDAGYRFMDADEMKAADEAAAADAKFRKAREATIEKLRAKAGVQAAVVNPGGTVVRG